MTMSCSKCRKPAVTFIRYNGTHLCKDHFIHYFDRRVKKEIKKQGSISAQNNIGVALSGGKDSTVALHLIHELFHKRPQMDIVALTVDEGIKNYRDKSIAFAKENCKHLGIEQHIISFDQVMDTTMDTIALVQDAVGECTYCGVFRRLCLNKKATELGLQRLITGHNLDDMAQSILMNFVNSDMQKLARLGPHEKVQPGFVPRMLPLRLIPEKEVLLYALVKNIAYYDGGCPYSLRAMRGEFRDIIDTLEYHHPGTRHSILNSYGSLKGYLKNQYPPVHLTPCQKCGEPTSQEICKTCMLLQRIHARG